MLDQLPLKKIISGGQTGADQGGLIAAAALLLDTGGWMPKGWRTEDGPRPEFESYGLEEHSDKDYKPRTRLNVESADGTVVFGDLSSAGSKYTVKLAKELDKPYVTFSTQDLWNPGLLLEFLHKNEIEVLNVAGNRESKNNGISDRVFGFLVRSLLFTEVIEDE